MESFYLFHNFLVIKPEIYMSQCSEYMQLWHAVTYETKYHVIRGPFHSIPLGAGSNVGILYEVRKEFQYSMEYDSMEYWN